jgi:hypothetical protein
VWHRTVRCAKRSNGRQRNGRLQRSADNVNNARTVRVESEQRQKTHWTINSACLVRHRTVRCTKLSELQRSKPSDPNGWVTWLAHRTVSGGAPDYPVCPSTSALHNGCFGGWGYKYPQPPPFKESKFPAYCIQYKSSRLHSKTQTRDQILSKVQNHSKHLVTCEREIFVFI